MTTGGKISAARSVPPWHKNCGHTDRGFLSDKIALYSLTKENFCHYLSDFDYARLHPINGPFSKWIDDKLTMRYILAPYAEHLPKYYFHIRLGKILCLMDLPPNMDGSIEGIILLLQQKGALAVKLTAGTHGAGFTRLTCGVSGYTIDNKPSSIEQLTNFLNGLLNTHMSEYIITEYLYGHNDLLKIWPQAPSVVRLITCRQTGLDPVFLYAFTLIPTLNSGITTNQIGDCVKCLINFDSGAMYNAAVLEEGKIVPCRRHPDSGVSVEGKVPHWFLVREKILEILRYIPQVRYTGMDVIVTETGFKIIEINSLPGIGYMQYDLPLLLEGNSCNFFNELLAEKKQARVASK